MHDRPEIMRQRYFDIRHLCIVDTLDGVSNGTVSLIFFSCGDSGGMCTDNYYLEYHVYDTHV